MLCLKIRRVKCIRTESYCSGITVGLSVVFDSNKIVLEFNVDAVLDLTLGGI